MNTIADIKLLFAMSTELKNYIFNRPSDSYLTSSWHKITNNLCRASAEVNKKAKVGANDAYFTSHVYVSTRSFIHQEICEGNYYKFAVFYFYPRELAKLHGYTSCFVVVAVAFLLVLYSMKQFENLPLQQGSLPATRACSLVSCHCTAAGLQPPRACSLVSCHCRWLQSTCMQFEKLPLQQGSDVRTHAVWKPDTAAGQLPFSGVSMHAARRQNYPAVGVGR
jgi:hypothetical protein